MGNPVEWQNYCCHYDNCYHTHIKPSLIGSDIFKNRPKGKYKEDNPDFVPKILENQFFATVKNDKPNGLRIPFTKCKIKAQGNDNDNQRCYGVIKTKTKSDDSDNQCKNKDRGIPPPYFFCRWHCRQSSTLDSWLNGNIELKPYRWYPEDSGKQSNKRTKKS